MWQQEIARVRLLRWDYLMKSNIEKIQIEHAKWQKRNFPDAKPWECLIGMQEELGELCRIYSKTHRGIRSKEIKKEQMDEEIGDVFIQLMGFCTLNGLSIDRCIDKRWGVVKNRNFQKIGV